MNAFLAIPLELRLLGLFALGAAAGALVNWWLDQLRFEPTWYSPWSRPPAKDRQRKKGQGGGRGKAAAVGPRTWFDRVPVFGWLSLSREAAVHGRGYWIRPMLVELVTGTLFAVLYAWEVEQLGLMPDLRLGIAGPPPVPWLQVHLQYAAHLLLITFMLTASLIDLDETLIPDGVTVPGAVVGLALASLYPWSLLPGKIQIIGGRLVVEYLHLASPHPWLSRLDPSPLSVALGLVCLWAWCLSLRLYYLAYAWYLPRRRLRGRPVGRSLRKLRKFVLTDYLTWIALAGTAAVPAVAAWGGDHWRGLLTALVGMVVGGGMVWVVRIVGQATLRKEAMGFGDVTLMAMMGTFLGWQAVIIVFFVAPFCGLVVGVLQLVLRGDRVMPYGPFLCLGGLIVILSWGWLWPRFLPIFGVGWLIPAVLAIGVVLMALLLMLIQLAKRLFAPAGGKK